MAKKTILGIFGVNEGVGAFTSNLLFTAGGADSFDVNTLDHYVEWVFTPTITIGGSSVGVTYSLQSGEYTRIGNRCYFTINITLSSKAALTGTVEIASMPFVGTALHSPVSIHTTSMTSGVGDTHLSANMMGGLSVVRPYKMVTGSVVQLTEADITNTSLFRINGSYRVS